MHMPEGMPKPERSTLTVQVSSRMGVPAVVRMKEAAMSSISSRVRGAMLNLRATVRMWG